MAINLYGFCWKITLAYLYFPYALGFCLSSYIFLAVNNL